MEFIFGAIFSLVIMTATPALDCSTSTALVNGTVNVYYDKQTCK